jgi:HEAT repeat protein
MKWMIVFTLFCLACNHPSARPETTQDEELLKLREEIAKARLENLGLKLRLARLLPRPEEELKVLEEALDSDLSELLAAAFREMATLSEEGRKAAVPIVLRRFAPGKEFFRIEATAFLGRVSSPEAEARVILSASDPAATVRKAAASALKTSSLEKSDAPLLRLLADPDRDVRLAAIDALGTARRESAVRPLSDLLGAGTDALVLEKTVDALGTIGSATALNAILDLLAKTPKEAVRWSCINSLGKIGDRRAGANLLPYIEPVHPLEIRQVAIESLGKLKETTALPRLGDLLRKDPEEKLRQAAAAALGLMADAEIIVPLLLPAYLEDLSEAARRAEWTAMVLLAGDGFAENERLALALLDRGRRPEAEQICARLHPSKPEGPLRARSLALEEAVARAAFSAEDFRAALPHYRQILVLAPDRIDVLLQVASCYRGMKDFDSCLKTLGEIKNPGPLIEEAHAQLQANPPDERKSALETVLRAGTLRLIEPLTGGDEAARKIALAAIRHLGRKILPALSREIEEGSTLAPAVLEAGAAITAIPNDPAATNDVRSKATAWRAWLETDKRK